MTESEIKWTREHELNNIKKLLLALLAVITCSYCINSLWI
jgi:hypothetical protein